MKKNNLISAVKSGKKPYHKPKIESEKVFETAALACGKCIAGNPVFNRNCTYNPRLS
jgi:hypothetical protein